jgi:pimeloyl-ACP methyl ester carboxylesterase
MLTGPDNSRLIADRIDNAELLVVPGANHSVHVEKTDLVISKIREFLEL